MRRKILAALFTLAALAGFAAPVSAEPMAAALSCHDGAVPLHYDYHVGPVEYGPYTTTSRCNDINMRLTTNIPGVYLYACVVFIDHTNECNHGGSYGVFGPPWGTVATDVKDGTHFKLRVGPYDTDAQHVNFQIAF